MKKATYFQLLRVGGIALFAIALFAGVSACHNDIKKDSGIIVSDLGEACDMNNVATVDTLVIKSSSELSAAIAGTGCTSSNFSVNFSNEILLGKMITAKCKIKKIYAQVTRDDATKRIVYKILVKDKGGCDTQITQWHWVTVPKFPSDYRVFFVVEKR